MKRKLFIWLTAVLLGISLPGIARAAEAPQLRMSVTASGNQVSAVITAAGLQDMYGYELHVAYDPLRMKFAKFESAFGGFSIPPVVKGGKVTLAHTKVGTMAGVNGEAELATLRFERIGGGASIFELQDVTLVDSKVEAKRYKLGLTKTLASVAAPVTLTDIAGHWGESRMKEAVELGFVNGYTNGTFQPNKAINRAEFAVMLARALRLPAGDEPKFTDAAQLPRWSTSYIAAAADAGIVSGYSDGTYQANKSINRAEMTAMIVRAGKLDVVAGSKAAFADVDAIAEWAQPYVKTAVNEGLVKGKGGNRFMPVDSATRAEAVTMILNLLHSSVGRS